MKVFIRPYFETSNDDDENTETTFVFFLHWPTGDAELGYTPNITVRYFDDESVFDAEFSYPTLLGKRPSGQFENSQLPGGPHQTEIQLDAGSNYTVSVYMNYQADMPKENGGDVCYLIQRDIERQFLREVSRTSRVDPGSTANLSHNQYDMEFKLLDIDLKFIHVYCSVPGYVMEYHANTLFKDEPIIKRIERRLPQIVTQNNIKSFNYFTLNVTFFATFDIAAASEELTLHLWTAEYSDVEVLVNDVVVIDTGYTKQCSNLEFLDSDEAGEDEEEARTADRVSITPERYEEQSCCAESHTGTVTIVQERSYHFQIRYRQWTRPRNGLCIRLYRESRVDGEPGSLPLDNIDLEARAAWELDDSPFFVHPVLNEAFLDLTQSHVIHHVHYNVNTRQELE